MGGAQANCRRGQVAASAMSRDEAPPAIPSAPSPSPRNPGGAGTWSAPDPPLAAHADDAVDYTPNATLDLVAHTIAGERDDPLSQRKRPAGAIKLWPHYLNAFKNERSHFLRERVGGCGSQPPEAWGSIDLRKLADPENPTGRALTSRPGSSGRDQRDEDEIVMLCSPAPRAAERRGHRSRRGLRRQF